MTRLLDILFSFIGLIILFPFFIIIGILILIDNYGPVFFLQKRVGKGGKEFRLIKFISMKVGSEKKGFITLGSKDSRITRMGSVLRKFKIDELPQLFNVLIGQMSLVGPRPEVIKYVKLYNEEQKKVLTVRPGITDFSSIMFADENRMRSNIEDPEKHYIEEVLPRKLNLSLIYVNNPVLGNYFTIIIRTFLRIFIKK
jgi:lipopolysaccharide/colanic/teichoic acid biosynthesis glycosyltransferase